MNSKSNYFRLGLFVLSALAILIISIGIIIGPTLFQPRTHMETYFLNSISGLEVGSPVKFRGIPVGEVEEILLSTEAYPQANQQILSEKNAVAVVRMKVNLADSDVKKQLKDYIDHGLRVQTQLAGITGSLYLSMEFLDSEKYPADRIPFHWEPKFLYVPSAPSLSNEIVDNIKNFLASLDQLDLKGNLEGTIPVIQSLVKNLERIAAGLNPEAFNSLGFSLRNLFDSAGNKIEELDIQKLNQLIGDLQNTANRVDNLTTKKEITTLIRNLTSLSTNLNGMLNNNQYDLSSILTNFNSIANSLKSLTSSLPSDPIDLLSQPAVHDNFPLNTKD